MEHHGEAGAPDQTGGRALSGGREKERESRRRCRTFDAAIASCFLQGGLVRRDGVRKDRRMGRLVWDSGMFSLAMRLSPLVLCSNA